MLKNNEAQKVYSCVSMKSSSIQNSVVKEIGETELSVLFVIASFCDEFNESSISQRHIAKVTGLSLPTINKAVNRLIDKRINSKAVLKRRFSNNSRRKNYSIYKINKDVFTLC